MEVRLTYQGPYLKLRSLLKLVITQIFEIYVHGNDIFTVKATKKRVVYAAIVF